MDKKDFTALLNNDAILDGFITGIYIVNARLYLSNRGEDRRAAERFFKSDFFRDRLGENADIIIEELKRKRKRGERKIKKAGTGTFIKSERGGYNENVDI